MSRPLVPRAHIVWLCVSSCIIVYECMFLMLRPATLKGGDLFSYFGSFEQYILIDSLFGDINSWFVVVLIVFNMAELILNAVGVLLYTGAPTRRGSNVGGLLLLIVSCFSFWKTLVYLVYDFHHVEWGEGNGVNFASLYVLPNLCWVGFPLAGIIRISGQLLGRLERGQTSRHKIKEI